jgi:cbb3-type cytochrome c oxidase subunit III
MRPARENYTAFMIAGLVLTLALVGAFAVYSWRETNRLALAAEELTSESIQRGGEIYQSQCSACHGSQGEGGIGPALNNRAVLKNTLDSVFFSVIRSGVPGTQMPAWSVDYGGPLTDEGVREVVAFMRAWEPTAPEIQPVVFMPDAGRGAVLFSSTCAICHGEGGAGTEHAPRLNDPQRLAALSDEWYRAVIRNGRPAKGMPTWGTVLSPNQIEDIVTLIAAWRTGTPVSPEFSVPDLLASALYGLDQQDPASASLQIERARSVVVGAPQDVLDTAGRLIDSGDLAGAIQTLEALLAQWPLGDPAKGAEVYSASCAACHGVQGAGGIGLPLNPSPFVQSQSNADLLAFLQAGRPGTAMAGYLDILPETDLANVIAFLRLWQPQP